MSDKRYSFWCPEARAVYDESQDGHLAQLRHNEMIVNYQTNGHPAYPPTNGHYSEFLKSKRVLDLPTGFEPSPFVAPLFPFQGDITKWAIRRGRAAVFADCGLGKTLMQLEWAHQVCTNTEKPVLILSPLGVDKQTAEEGARFGIPCSIAKHGTEVNRSHVFITNYEKLHRFDDPEFSGVVCDESSILKSYDGKTRTQIINRFARTPFKLACTATPAPNDYMELANHAEFLGVMTRMEMLSMFFTHDGGETSKWRLKGHAKNDFWKWLCSWAVMLRKPSDLGYSDDGFDLPPLNIIERIVESPTDNRYLIPIPASTLSERRDARRSSLGQRIYETASIVRSSKEKTLIWCNLNDEQDALENELNGLSVSVRGATGDDDRIKFEKAWREGDAQCFISKPDIFGWGMNWQFANRMIFCGLSDSYEQFYQAVRREYRFGQKNPVDVFLVISSAEHNVLQNIQRKHRDAEKMAREMVGHLSELSSVAVRGSNRTTTAYNPTQQIKIPSWLKTQ